MADNIEENNPSLKKDRAKELTDLCRLSLHSRQMPNVKKLKPFGADLLFAAGRDVNLKKLALRLTAPPLNFRRKDRVTMHPLDWDRMPKPGKDWDQNLYRRLMKRYYFIGLWRHYNWLLSWRVSSFLIPIRRYWFRFLWNACSSPAFCRAYIFYIKLENRLRPSEN